MKTSILFSTNENNEIISGTAKPTKFITIKPNDGFVMVFE